MALRGREHAVQAAAWLFDGGEPLPRIEDSEYMRGITEVIADTFGTTTDKGDPPKEAVWDLIHAAWKHQVATLRVCDADGCGQFIQPGEAYYYHVRLMAVIHPECYRSRLVRGEDVSHHAVRLEVA